MAPTPSDPQIAVVREDLHYLREEWGESISDPALRRGSTVLRHLLVDGELQRAWKGAGCDREPRVTAVSLELAIGALPVGRIAFASAGGALYNGMRVAGFMLHNGALSAEQMAERGSHRQRPEEAVGIRAFTEASCLIVGGTAVARRHVIKYIANKLGGSHFDERRARKTGEDRIFARLDEIGGGGVKLANKDSIYFELLSIGQALATSEDLERLAPRA